MLCFVWLEAGSQYESSLLLYFVWLEAGSQYESSLQCSALCGLRQVHNMRVACCFALSLYFIVSLICEHLLSHRM